MKYTIVRYSEIGLKGKNKSDFEKKLIDNIRAYMRRNNISFEKIKRSFSRILIETEEKPNLSFVFGISSYSYAEVAKPDFDSIKNEVGNHLNSINSKTTFRVSTQRLDKTFPKTSVEMDKEIGAFVVEKTSAKVSLKKYEKEVCIEILPEVAFVFDNRHRGPGGLPVGVEGTVLTLMEDDGSINAAKLMMKRGCDVILIGFENKDVGVLQKHSAKKLEFKKIKNIKEAEALAEEYDAKALVVSQTLKNFKEIDTKLLVFRPLIAK